MIVDIKLVIFCSIIGTILYSVSLFMPLIGGIISFFSPIPLGYVGVKRDKISLYICFAITLLMLFFVSGKIGTILYLVQYGVPFMLFFEIYNRGRDTIKAVIISIVSMLIITMFALWVNASFDFNNLFVSIKNFLDANFQIVLKSYKSLGLSDKEISDISANLKSFVNVITKIMPSLMVMFYCSIFMLNLPLIERFSKVKFKKYNLLNFKTPFYFIWSFIISGFGLFLLGKSTFWWILLNIFITVCFLFLIQGFMVMEFWFNKLRFSKIMKNLIYILILFSQFLLVSIAIIGLFDNWFDFRKTPQSGGTNESNT